MATRMQISTDRNGLRVIGNDAHRSLFPDSYIRCPKCGGLDPDCDLCVSETPVANIWHHLRTAEQIDLAALYAELDSVRRERI